MHRYLPISYQLDLQKEEYKPAGHEQTVNPQEPIQRRRLEQDSKVECPGKACKHDCKDSRPRPGRKSRIPLQFLRSLGLARHRNYALISTTIILTRDCAVGKQP